MMVEPWHALAFLVFTLLLQLCDGYVIKPKLFGNSLGVSGLLILIWIIVGGSMFGVIGILLAIPFAAILDFVYRDYFLPMLEGRNIRFMTSWGIRWFGSIIWVIGGRSSAN